MYERITNDLELRFGENFFIDGSGNYFQETNSGQYTPAYYLGIEHRFQHSKIQLITSFFQGATEVETGIYTGTMKEKGGNEIVKYDLRKFDQNSAGESFIILISILPSIQLGYQLTSFLYINSNFSYNVSFSNLTFKEILAYELSANRVETLYEYRETSMFWQVGPESK